MAHVGGTDTQEHPSRISQLLPTVKCSSCCQSVALADLGDHVCPPQPPQSIPALRKPPMSPKSATSLLPQRLQNLVSSPGTPQRPSLDKQTQEHFPVRSPSQHDPFQRLPPTVNIRSTPKKFGLRLPAHDSPSPAHALVGRASPHVRPLAQSAPERVPTPVRNAQRPVVERISTPSNAARTPASPARGAPLPNPFDDTTDKSHHTIRTGISLLVRGEKLSSSPPSILKTSSNPMPPTFHSRPPERACTPSVNPAVRPSLDKYYPPLDRAPTVDPQSYLGSRRSPSDRTTATSPSVSVARPPRAGSTVPLPTPGTVPFPSSPNPAPTPPAPTRQPLPPINLPRSPIPEHERDIDTKIGGEAGMAGVGRRGFAAAARAAMFAATLPQQQQDSLVTHENARRVNAPQYLDISTTMGYVMRAAMTPPLSPNSGRTPSPVSPVSLGNTTPTSDQYPNPPSPHDALSKQDKVSPKSKGLPLDPSSANVRIASPSRTPSPIANPFERRLSGETITQSPIPAPAVQLPLLDGLKRTGEKRDGAGDSDEESIYTTHTSELGRARRGDDAPMSPSMDSDVGLAYADDSEDDTPVVMPLNVRKSNSTNQVKFPTVSSPDRNHTSGPTRKESAASARSAMSSRSTPSSTAGSNHGRNSVTTQSTRSAGALERAMESLIEEGASVSVLASGSVLASISGSSSGSRGKPSRANTVPGPASPEHKPPKLPMRSHTSPSHPLVHSERVGVIGEIPRVRNRVEETVCVCARCVAKIEDGKWIRMDGGSVLCERCWKNMYLPKCRRCYLPIEKQAVSSKDGQLKGKYHRDCFSCHTCRKPFPDKEFYVFEGKPFCGYHYHEANNSLCAAISCGQPIEGPCAVTHLGKRYHPEHLLCEFEDSCGERLVEYWEVDGQMFCEMHAGVWASRYGGLTRDGVDALKSGRLAGADEGRAMKRMTRFIDLGSGEDEEVDIG
ncbi:hypothetical protein F5I97DRAFT_561025 [Phlebopus sp. FC_14]|nr:hypothetical protein F5I97DRAFT_561025 [Phlebopus sp. FC_14]